MSLNCFFNELNNAAAAAAALVRRQGSVDMKYGLLDPSRLETSFGNKYLLTVDEAYYNRCRRKNNYVD